MHSEHISNLHPGWVVGGWLVAVAAAGVALFVMVGTGLVGAASPASDFAVLAAVAFGFFSGGFFVGLRWANAPILHGVALTLLSVVVWFLWELLDREGGVAPPGYGAGFVLGIVLLQLAAAVAGGMAGRRLVRRGETPTPFA